MREVIAGKDCSALRIIPDPQRCTTILRSNPAILFPVGIGDGGFYFAANKKSENPANFCSPSALTSNLMPIKSVLPSRGTLGNMLSPRVATRDTGRLRFNVRFDL